MNVSIPLWAFAAAAAVAAVLYVMYRFARSIERSAGRIEGACSELGATIVATSSTLNQLRDQIVTNMGGIPKVLEGVTRIAGAQLEILQAQRAEADVKTQNPFGRPNGPMPPRDVAAANLEHEVQQMMRAQGMSREEALLHLNPANAGSVWGGGNFFSGWEGQ